MRVTPQLDTIHSFPICNRADAQFSPSVAFNGENYIVTWTDRRFTGTYFWVTAARVTPQGAVLDTGYCVGSADAHSEFYPHLAYDGSRCFAIWYHTFYEPYGIFGRFINKNTAQPEDTVIMISPTLHYLYNFPKVAFGSSNYFAVWADKRDSSSTDYDIFGRLVTAQGQFVSNRITIATGAQQQTRPDVAFDGSQYLVAWREEGAIHGQKFTSDGQFIGSSFRISDSISFSRDCPRVCAGSSNYCVVWSEEHGGFSDIYGNVDVVAGVDENTQKALRIKDYSTSIIAGPLVFPEDCGIFDVTGRAVLPQHTRPGVYFIHKSGKVVRKIIKIK